MKKFKIAVISVFLWIGTTANVLANGVNAPTFPNPTNYNSLEEIINAALSILRPLFIITLAGMILYGAWVWLTSQGDDTKIATAKKIITAAIIGFAIAVIAPSIASVVAGFIGIKGLNSL